MRRASPQARRRRCKLLDKAFEKLDIRELDPSASLSIPRGTRPCMAQESAHGRAQFGAQGRAAGLRAERPAAAAGARHRSGQGLNRSRKAPNKGLTRAPVQTRRSRPMAKVIGIDLGTTNSCVADHGGRQAPRHREQRGRPHHAVDRRLHEGRRSAGRPAGQAPGGHQSAEHPLRGEAPHRPQVRRRGRAAGHQDGPVQDRRRPTTATPGSRCRARRWPRRKSPRACS